MREIWCAVAGSDVVFTVENLSTSADHTASDLSLYLGKSGDSA